MKYWKIMLVAAPAVAMMHTALADKYDDLARKGYRWINFDGPFACPSKDDLRKLIRNQAENEFQMIGQLRAHYLVRGEVAQVLQEDTASGMSQIELGWTLSKFLSKRPIPDWLGKIELPSATPSPETTPVINDQLGASAMPGATPTP